MAATTPTPEVIAGKPRGVSVPPPDRLEIMRQLTARLQAAVACWPQDAPLDICRRTQELETLRAQFDLAPEAAAEDEQRAAELLGALAAAARELRRMNDVYQTLLRAAQRAIGLRLRHLSAYAPVYAPPAAPPAAASRSAGAVAAGAARTMDPLFWDRPPREARA